MTRGMSRFLLERHLICEKQFRQSVVPKLKWYMITM